MTDDDPKKSNDLEDELSESGSEPFEAVEIDDDLPPLAIAADEPILTALLREAISADWRDDAVMHDFCTLVLPTLVNNLTALPAKGGDFALTKAEQGADTARYAVDQTLRAHILNGLLATIRIHAAAGFFGSDAALKMGDYGRRLIIAGYILHDYNKMPDVKRNFKEQFDTDQVNPSALTMHAIGDIVRAQAENFALPEFFEAGGHALPLADLIYVIHNTQGMWGTLPERLLAAIDEDVSDSRLVSRATAFSHIADLLAYGTFLEGGTLKKINDLLVVALKDPPFKLTAHRITQVTGIVTAYLHNAVVSALVEAGHVPILFAPNGVIYASPTNALMPDLNDIAQTAGEQIKQAAMLGIERAAGTAYAVGIAWGTQGLKTAPFVNTLYTPDRVLALVWKRLRPRLMELAPRKRQQLKVSKKLESGVQHGWFTTEQVLELTPYMDERAEALGDWLAYASTMEDAESIVEMLLAALNFDMVRERTLIETAQKGGVQFWPYILALRYIRNNAGHSPEQIDQTVTAITSGLLAERYGGETHSALAGHIEQHARQVVLLPRSENDQSERFTRELANYHAAKVNNKTGVYDTVYNIPFGVEKQQEATLPYMPTPYSQRLPLGSSDSLDGWRRGLSGVGVANMLLMQTALRQPFQFEDRKGKMLYLYPVYFFTPETGRALLGLVQRLRYFDLNDWLKHTERGLVVDAKTVNTFHAVMRQPDKYAPPVQVMRYPEIQAPTLVQVAVDPGKDATDASSWVNALFMALILACVVDVKVVVSESPSPLYPSGVAFNDTIILDAPHAAFTDLIGRQINVDHVLGMLQRLTVVVAVLRDAYGFDLAQIVRIIRVVSDDSAYALDAYRRLSDERESRGYAPSPNDARRYLEYIHVLETTHPLGKQSAIMNHARQLVERYRKFYRAKGYASNAILRPIQAAADVILKSGPAQDDLDMLTAAVTGRLIQIDNAIMSGDTLGFTPRGSTIPARQEAMRDFAAYFVQTYFRDGLQSRKANLRGDQFNVLRLACDATYRTIDADERAAQPDQNDISDTNNQS